MARRPDDVASEFVTRLARAAEVDELDTFDEIVTHAAVADAYHDVELRAAIRRHMAAVEHPAPVLTEVFDAIRRVLDEQDALWAKLPPQGPGLAPEALKRLRDRPAADPG